MAAPAPASMFAGLDKNVVRRLLDRSTEILRTRAKPEPEPKPKALPRKKSPAASAAAAALAPVSTVDAASAAATALAPVPDAVSTVDTAVAQVPDGASAAAAASAAVPSPANDLLTYSGTATGFASWVQGVCADHPAALKALNETNRRLVLDTLDAFASDPALFAHFCLDTVDALVLRCLGQPDVRIARGAASADGGAVSGGSTASATRSTLVVYLKPLRLNVDTERQNANQRALSAHTKPIYVSFNGLFWAAWLFAACAGFKTGFTIGNAIAAARRT